MHRRLERHRHKLRNRGEHGGIETFHVAGPAADQPRTVAPQHEGVPDPARLLRRDDIDVPRQDVARQRGIADRGKEVLAVALGSDQAGDPRAVL